MRKHKIDKRRLKSFIRKAIIEDVKDGDHTSLACIKENQVSRAHLLIKDKGVLAGVEIAREVFLFLDPQAKLEVFIEDGSEVSHGDIAFILECNTQALLKGERLALNTMQRLSGIASLSRTYFNAVKNYDVTVLDTRKTTPLLRFLEKWAVAIGGCSNYRDGLYDRIMIKDNHIEAAGGIRPAVEKVLDYLEREKLDLDMTIEVRSLEELKEVLNLDIRPRIMLDNFSMKNLRIAVEEIDGRFESEASGGIELNSVREVASTGVKFISVGALTHSAQCLDLSLKIIK